MTMLHFYWVFISVWSYISYSSSISNKSPLKVVIAGGGPAGLLTAHALLNRVNSEYNIQLLESREDPRTTELGPRAYSLGLNLRGQSAIKYFDDKFGLKLWPAVSQQGVESDSFFLHIGKNKFQIRKSQSTTDTTIDDKVPPTLLIPRDRLCSALLSELEQSNQSRSNVHVQFNTQLSTVDLLSHSVATSNGETIEYDWLIGCDGVQSAVRGAMMNASRANIAANDFYSEEVVLPGRFKVIVQPQSPLLESDAVHAMEAGKSVSNFSLFVIPSINNQSCALINWRGSTEEPPPLRNDAPVDVTKQAIESAYPLFGKVTDAAIAQLRRQRPSEARTVRCNRYHSSVGAALLLGDAAHSTGGALGQGANSALLDVVALDQCLDACENNIHHASELFSQRQVPEGLALWKLLQLPPPGPLGLIYNLTQVLWTLFARVPVLRRFVPRSTQTTLSQTMTPFSAIVKKNGFWVERATRRFTQINYIPESVQQLADEASARAELLRSDRISKAASAIGDSDSNNV